MIFIINLGSSSKRYALYKNGVCIASIHVRNTHEIHELVTYRFGSYPIKIGTEQYGESAKLVLDACITHELLSSFNEIAGIGIRIVTPGSYFLPTQEITQEYMHKLESTVRYAPLHSLPILDEIKQVKPLMSDTPFFGVSDSAFHATMPEYARVYGVSSQDTYNLDIFKFGYHGLSVSSVIKQVAGEYAGKIPENIIVCHLGSGCSVTAVKNGKSIDTTMGYSPNEGLVMATRSGDINTSAYLKIKDVHNWNDAQTVQYLNQECGLHGMSGGASSEIQILLNREKKHTPDLPVGDVFVYRLVKAIGSLGVALNGIDVLIFTGGIGEHVPEVRLQVVKKLSVLDFKLNMEKNNVCNKDKKLQKISSDHSKKDIFVVESKEMQEIFLAIEKLI